MKVDATKQKLVQEFGAALVRLVRDEAIRMADEREVPPRTMSAQRWSRLDQETIRMVTPDIVDKALFALLKAIDDNQIALTFKSESGVVDLCVDGLGELAGWYSGEWRERGEERWNPLVPGHPPETEE